MIGNCKNETHFEWNIFKYARLSVLSNVIRVRMFYEGSQ